MEEGEYETSNRRVENREQNICREGERVGGRERALVVGEGVKTRVRRTEYLTAC